MRWIQTSLWQNWGLLGDILLGQDNLLGLACTSTNEGLPWVTWASVFSTTWPRFSLSRRHLDLDNLVPSLNAVSHDKKSASVQQADVQTNLSPAKNLQLCDKKLASVRLPLHIHLLIRCRSRLWGTTQESWHCKCGTRISWLPCFTHERTLSCRAGKVLGVHHEQNKEFFF